MQHSGAMEFSIDFGGDPQDVTVTLSGIGDVREVARCNDALMSDSRFRPGLAILVDCTDLETPLPFDDQEQALEMMAGTVAARDWVYPPRAIAFVVAGHETEEALTAWRAHQGGSQSRRRVFHSREDALEWLAAERP